jgi:predicted O-linked N-acetylglucosamine transferase (SPINDLY family)
VSLASRQKLHPTLLAAWEAILGGRARAELELLPSVSPEQARRMVPGLAAHLPTTRVRLRPRVPREVVADLLVDADLYLDSYPFGGFNTLVEVLAAGCPVVTLEGSQARNRFGAAVLRRLGCPDWLIARDWAGYVTAARRLLDDARLRAEVRAAIGGRERVLAALADPAAERHFEAALAWMQARGPRAGRRPGPPVRVEAG